MGAGRPVSRSAAGAGHPEGHPEGGRAGGRVAAPAGPAPAFEQLSGSGKYISEDQASAYPLLANDFIYADHNRDGRISKSEYARWTTGK